MDDFSHVDLGWQPEPLRDDWPRGRDTEFMMWRIEQAFVGEAKLGGPGRLLEVAFGEAKHVRELQKAGWDWVGIEPSPEMLTRAHEVGASDGLGLEMMRGIGEVLPFRDATFDRVICMSSLDHFANPDVGMREMGRLLKPEGRLVIGLVNYGGIGCQGSRLVYKVRRALRLVPRGKRLFWDDPTVGEHTFEGSIPALKRFAAGSLRMERAYGASMLWAFPGWSGVLSVIPAKYATGGLDRIARRVPGLSDFIVTTWRRA